VAKKSPPVVLRNGCVAGAKFGRELSQPGAVLFGDQLNPDLYFLQPASLHDPDYFAAGFFGFILNANDVAHLNFVLETVNAGAAPADILGGSVLVKGLVI
jgi:hypothetical protein